MSPATSEKMRRYFCLAMSVKEGKTPRSDVSKRVLETADKISLAKLREYCESPVKES